MADRANGKPRQEAIDADAPFIVPLCAVFRRHLKSEGQKFTPERAQVLDTIIQLDRVFEADELLYELRDRGMRVSKATIYRTLKLLQDAGIIESVPIDQKQAHYQLAYGRGPTDQLVCVETGAVIEFSAAEITQLRDRIAREHGWAPVGHRFQIFAVSPEGTAPESNDE
ncbi:MAG: Fur family transcriptional regulator [Phycisphaerales bacterium]